MSTPWTTERKSRFQLARTAGIGPLRFSQALERFQTAEKALRILTDAGKISPPSISQIEDEIARTEKLGAQTLLYGDANYPASLAAIPDFPPILHVKGKLSLLHQKSIAIVGARNASSAGLAIASQLAKKLAEKKITIVSGLASGIDGQAHRSALTETGSTVAALPGGLDIIYPREHLSLYEEIAESGCVITEAPPGASILARHFPKRNRFIAGLSLGTVIIEAARKSGTLITANFSLDYDRLVFAVPGSPLDPRSAGGNHLIKEGAILVENAEDILIHLPQEAEPSFSKNAPKSQKLPPKEETTPSLFTKNDLQSPDIESEKEDLPPHAQKILCLLSPVPITIEALILQSKLSAQEVLTTISLLNLLERVSLHPSDTISLAPQK
ncbi:DNA-protecting protein DprA [Acetobacteraceae bacterium]|nr:DNA-protecting protein DprA [Acetobacteraceae bacterium]